jgi:type II secretory pathway pseudopilin PulG
MGKRLWENFFRTKASRPGFTLTPICGETARRFFGVTNFRKMTFKNSGIGVTPQGGGFTLVEALVGTAIFAILVLGILAAFSSLTTLVKLNRERTQLTSLADSYLEVVRNLPYSQVGTLTGNPNGNLPDQTNPDSVDLETGNYRIYYEVTYIDDPADGTILAGTDPAPNDYKQVKMFVENVATGGRTTFLTNVSPQGAEGMVNAGAIMVKVFDSQGQPVSGATTHIENLAINPNIVLNRTSDADGNWLEVALPASVNNYHIVVTKAGYSSDQTYPITPQNPNPIKPDATVLVGQVTQISFTIDLLSNLDILTLGPACQNLSNVGVNVRGDKLIGNTPNVYKFNQNYSSVAGHITLNNIEWDTYTPTLLTGQGWMVYGTSPIQSINVLPGTSQTFSLILGPYTTNSLLVIVKNAATGAPLEGASVHLIKGGSVPQDYYGSTGGSVWTQYDWTAGSGQTDFVEEDRYFADDGNVNVVSVPTGLRLLKVTGQYLASGELESSTYDTGTAATHYTNLVWEPNSQVLGTELKFQIATNNDKLTWNYLGPDGTSGSYYTVSGTSINPIHNSQRYIRYKVYLSTFDDHHTPVLTSLNINYVSGCFTPGQAIFTDLTSGNNYDLEVSLAGYTTQYINSMTVDGNQLIEVLMSP